MCQERRGESGPWGTSAFKGHVDGNQPAKGEKTKGSEEKRRCNRGERAVVLSDTPRQTD
ncbi:Hypothetical predicted protein, partial [Marmota monax]